MIRDHLVTVCFSTLLAAVAPAAQPAPPAAAPVAAADLQLLPKIAQKLAPRFVQVEYSLKSDMGDAPTAGGWLQRCPNCGNYHVNAASEAVADDRPALVAGIVLDARHVVVPDVQVHPRFVRQVVVRSGETRIEAAPAAYALQQNAIILELKGDLPGATPLKADPSLAGPFYQATYARMADEWTMTVDPLGGGVNRGETRTYMTARPGSIVVNRDAAPVGVVMDDELPLDDQWKGGTDRWAILSAADYQKKLDALEKQTNRSLLAVHLHFRSPRANGSPAYSMRGFGSGDEQAKTDVTALGVLVAEKTLLVLHDMPPQVTARLERVSVQVDGKPQPARFLATLSDYGGLLVTLDAPLPGAARLWQGDARTLRSRLLLAAEISVQGDQRTARFAHRRIPSFAVGWRENLYPKLPDEESGRLRTFLFDEEGKLVVLPISRRERGQDNAYRSSREETGVATLAMQLAGAVQEPTKFADASNTPLSETDELRLGWLGVQVQQLTEELAETNKVSDLTRNGEIGALVSFVYPGSPAAAAGIQPLDVLVNIHVPGKVKPLEISARDYESFGGQFPWEQLDQLPEQMLDRVPIPWPDLRNPLNQMLTEIGIGKPYQLELVRDGKPLRLDLTVTASPAYYASAPRHKHEGMGITVRDITFEVQQYLQRKTGEVGVVISRIEQGSKAFVAGLRPYEVITHVNDQPVLTAADFAKATANQRELRLSVRRMNKARLVRLSLPQAATAPSTAPVAAVLPTAGTTDVPAAMPR